MTDTGQPGTRGRGNFDPGGEGVENLGGVVHPGSLKTLILFKTKICDFPNPTQDLILKCVPCFGPAS